MPRIQVRGADFYYDSQGYGQETVFFAHGILMSGEMFRAQVEALGQRYRCITFDWRGHGRSAVTANGYEVEEMYRDASALIEQLQAAPCHLVAFSMSGFAGLRVAARRPELLRSLTLIDTSAAAETILNRVKYQALSLVYRRVNRAFAVAQAMQILFGPRFNNLPVWRPERAAWRRHMEQMDPRALKQVVAAVAGRPDVAAELAKITAPTLILAGADDRAIAPRYAEQLRAGIANSRLVAIPAAGHTTPVEAPEAVNEALVDFLASV